MMHVGQVSLWEIQFFCNVSFSLLFGRKQMQLAWIWTLGYHKWKELSGKRGKKRKEEFFYIAVPFQWAEGYSAGSPPGFYQAICRPVL